MIFIDGNKKKTKIHSNYWLSDWADDSSITSYMNATEKSSYDTYKLAAAKRAISNFVNIVTNKQIPVTFNTRGDSYTDGKQVVIGAEVVNPKDFDIAVGLALHEGSHIKLSDFTLLQQLDTLISQSTIDSGEAVGITNVKSTIKDLWNYVEDRRIDFFVYTSAPGYREYYRSMYDKYFNSPVIDQALKSDSKRDETLESYFFRIINMHNPNTDLSALKGMREIYKTIDLQKIERLLNSKDAFDVAVEVFNIIVKNLDAALQEEANQKAQQQSQGQGQGNGGSGNGESGESTEPTTLSDEEFDEMLENSDFSESGDAESGDSAESEDGDSENEGGDGSQSDGQSGKGGKFTKGKGGKKSTTIKLTPRQAELLEKKIKEQKAFMDGDTKKKTISKADNKAVSGIEESGSELSTVGQDVTAYGNNPQKGISCIVVKKLTQNLLESNMFPMSSSNYGGGLQKYNEKAVEDGIRIGTILGKKLQVRSEDRTTVYNRQKIGKIDKRMVSSLGFGNENVFQFNEVDTYNKANLHVSIDASGSMAGSKWDKTITNVVALCKAVDMIAGLEIQVTFRTSTDNKPYIVLAYDSRVDKFSKVKKMFPYLDVTGTTPEGLCFEAIMKEFLASSTTLDSYFINISDGEPYFSGSGFHYGGNSAFDHTKKMVKKIEAMGIKTLSYYVDSYARETVSAGFQTMYGKGAVAIDVTNLSQITKTVNKMFMSK